MSSLASELQAGLATALNNLEERLDQLDVHLKAEAGYPLWVWKTEHAYSERDYARTILRATDFIQGQDANATRICPALMGASAETLAAARAVNAYKQKLDAALKAIDRYQESRPDEESLLRHQLGLMGRVHFHRRQALREIVVLERTPEKVSFTWARFNKVLCTNRDKLLERIEKWIEHRGFSPDRIHDLDVLRSLPHNETLAEVRPPHIHPRANVVTSAWDGDLKADRKARIQVRAVLPILYPAERGDCVPLQRALPLEAPTGDKRPRGTPRNPVSEPRRRVGSIPILKSLPVYRYV